MKGWAEADLGALEMRRACDSRATGTEHSPGPQFSVPGVRTHSSGLAAHETNVEQVGKWTGSRGPECSLLEQARSEGAAELSTDAGACSSDACNAWSHVSTHCLLALAAEV